MGTALFMNKINGLGMLFSNSCKKFFITTLLLQFFLITQEYYFFNERSHNYILSLKISECIMASSALTGIIKQIHKSMKHTNALL